MGAERAFRRLRHGTRVRLNALVNGRRVRRARAGMAAASPGRRVVAVLLLEHLGDVAACEPVARHLKELDPGCFLVWGVRPQYRELVDASPQVDLVLPLHCLSEGRALARAGLFDRVVDLHFDDRWCPLCRTPLRRASGSAIGMANYFRHGGILTAFAKSAGLPALEEAPRLILPPAAVAKVDGLGLPARFVAVNATSNFPEKDWPAARWNELAARIERELALPVVEIGLAPVLGESGAASTPSRSLCGRLSILESAEVIRRAVLFVGGDSGPAHLANAVGARGVLLMGSFLGFPVYNPFSGRYARGEGVAIVRAAGPVRELAAERVFAAVRAALRA